MTSYAKHWLTWAILAAAGASAAWGVEVSGLRAYPDPLPEDVSYDTVVKSQSLPLMKYVLNVLGTKVHPEEFHLTSSGEIILPYSDDWQGLCLAPLVGTRLAEDGAGPIALALPPADGVISSLIDGCLPAVENQWQAGDLQIRQLAFATSGGKFESITGREPIVALVRYTLTNRSSAPQEVEFVLQFGQAHRRLSVKKIPPVSPRVLSFQSPFIRQEDGANVACLLTKGENVSFKPFAGPQANPAHTLVLNEKEENVACPDYTISIERQGDKITVGPWQSPAGVDFYLDASRSHSSPAAVDLEVVGADNVAKPVGKLSRTGFSAEDRPATDYLAPGEHSVAFPWAELAKALPQGASNLVVRCYYPSEAGRKLVSAWSPIVVLTRSGAEPRFKNPELKYSDENRLTMKQTLAAGESKTIDLAVPYFPLPEQARGQLESLRFDDELNGFRKFWNRELNRAAEFAVPEKRIRDAYRTCVANNMILTDRDPASGVLLPHPDALAYENVWAGDSGVIIQAMDRMGYHREAESMIDYFLARQGKDKPEGDVLSAEGFFSGDIDMKWMNQNGFVLWAMAEHYKLTRDEPWLRRVAPQMVKGCDWIIRERARTKVVENGQKVKHFGLLPKGRPSDLHIWDNWFWSDTYSYMGLRGTADILSAIGMKEAARLAAEADDYKACILDSVERAIDPNVKPTFVPPTPYRIGPPSFDFFNETWYTICGPIYMVEAGLLNAKDEKAGGINYWLERYGLYSGMPAFMAGDIDPYYIYNQSLSQLLRGESAKFDWTLYSITAYAMGQGTYATIEGHNLVTGFNSEIWSWSRQPHMHSNSRYIDLVRIALLLEEGQTLHLMAGTPRGWLADGQNIEVKRAPSYFGEVNFTARSNVAQGKVAIEIEPFNWESPNVVLHVRTPTQYGKIKSVQVNGKEWKDFDDETVRLPKMDKKTGVICVFK